MINCSSIKEEKPAPPAQPETLPPAPPEMLIEELPEELEELKEEELEKLKEEVLEELKEEAMDGKPEYNIEVEPRQSREPLVLLPNTRTNVNFFIGPRSDESLTPGIETSDLIDALANGRKFDLTVTLFCNVSETDTYQQRKIKYNPESGQSSSAEFVVFPSLAAVHDNNGLGKLIFVVDANGMEIDIIRLDAIVGDPLPEALEMYNPPAKLSLDRILPEDISVPDLIIAFAPAQGGGAIPIVIRPILRELLRQIQEELGNPNKEFWIFESGVKLDDLRGLVKDNYIALRTLVEQNNQDLQNIYKSIGVDTDLPPGLISAFEEDATEKILRVMADKGADLYWRIFERGDEGLSRALKIINSFSLDRPLRLMVVAENIYAPWQILYSDPVSQSINPYLFWGFRYELGTLQLVDKAQGRMRAALSNPRPDEVIFGAWRGLSDSNEKDEVRERADMLKEHLETHIGRGIKYCHSKVAFISEIQSRSSTVKLILVYGHGSSGTEIVGHVSESDERTVITVPNVLGPYFIFRKGPNEILIPKDFDRLARSVSRYDLEPYFLKSQPFVILNACETGTAGIRTADNNGFVGALTRMGARAVIVTEAPVWANFAHQFGKDLINLLFGSDRKEIRTALLEARLKHLEKAGNPFGLIYSLYGNPAARITKE